MRNKIKQHIAQVHRGEVPKEWQLRPLREIVSPIHKKAKGQKLETLSISAGVGFVNQAEKFGKEMSGAQYVNYTVLEMGDFSYNKGNSKKYPQGCIYMLKERKAAAVPNVFNSFRMNSAICDGDYYANLFTIGYLNRQLCRYINSGVRNDGLLNLYDEDFYSCKVPVPPIVEQQKIAEVLAQCDRVIALKQELLAEKRKQKKWLMQNLLNPNSGMRLPGFEKSIWKETDLVSCSKTKGQYGLNAPSCEFCKGLPRYIRITDISDDGNYIKNNNAYVDNPNSHCYILNKGDLLFVRTGATVGKTYMYDENDGELVYAGFLIRFSIDESRFNSLLINYLCNTTEYWNWVVTMSTRSGQPGINAEEYGSYKFKIPPTIQEQAAIANVISIADKEIGLLVQELAAWEEKKKGLSQLLLTGLVRV